MAHLDSESRSEGGALRLGVLWLEDLHAWWQGYKTACGASRFIEGPVLILVYGVYSLGLRGWVS